MITIGALYPEIGGIPQKIQVWNARLNSTDDICVKTNGEIVAQLMEETKKSEDAAKTLTSIYCDRTDLQQQFTTNSEDGSILIAWACSVASGTIDEESSKKLKPYSNEYCESATTFARLKAEKYEEISRMIEVEADSIYLRVIETVDLLIENVKEMLTRNEVFVAQLLLEEVQDLLDSVPRQVTVPEESIPLVEDKEERSKTEFVERTKIKEEFEVNERHYAKDSSKIGFTIIQLSNRAGIFDVSAGIQNETVKVIGKVPLFYDGEAVTIQVFNPNNQIYEIEQVMHDMEGIYHTTMEMKGSLAIDGVYTVKATYLGYAIQTTLEVSSN